VNMLRVIGLSLVVVVSAQTSYGQIEATKLGECVGYTVILDTNIQGEFEGPDYDRVVKLDNGWVIEFHEYDYFYEYHPEIVILARQMGAGVLYKAVIDGGDDVYDITRVR
jgi:hypothetical protein